jgi:hypothetical protein
MSPRRRFRRTPARARGRNNNSRDSDSEDNEDDDIGPIDPDALLSASSRPRPSAKNDMYVPSEALGGVSPERRAAGLLVALFTHLAARIVLAQLSGSGRGALGAYSATSYATLEGLLREQKVDPADPDAWLRELMRRDQALAVRVMEVRRAYASSQFEYGSLERLSKKIVGEGNVKVMREQAARSLRAAWDGGGEEGAGGGGGGGGGGGRGEEEGPPPSGGFE